MVQLGGALVDFAAVEAWEAQRLQLWAGLAFSALAPALPTLLLYSWDDELVDPYR